MIACLANVESLALVYFTRNLPIKVLSWQQHGRHFVDQILSVTILAPLVPGTKCWDKPKHRSSKTVGSNENIFLPQADSFHGKFAIGCSASKQSCMPVSKERWKLHVLQEWRGWRRFVSIPFGSAEEHFKHGNIMTRTWTCWDMFKHWRSKYARLSGSRITLACSCCMHGKVTLSSNSSN